jgi:hypothetical protein
MTGRPDVPLPDESHGPYTEGWPKFVEWQRKLRKERAASLVDGIYEHGKDEVVPLSDAERLQRTLEDEDSRWANIYAQKCTENERLREDSEEDRRMILGLEDERNKLIGEKKRLREAAQRNADWCDDLKAENERLREALDACYDKPWRTRLIIEKAFLDREGEG